MSASCVLKIEPFPLSVHLGWTDSERVAAQHIAVEIQFQYPGPNQTDQSKALQTDELDDTLCYETVYRKLVSYTKGKEFRLIESLAYQLYGIAKEMSGRPVRLKLYKKPPTLPELEKGVSFSIQDW